MSCIFSIDVEDWFHILEVPGAPRPFEWNSLPSRIDINLLRLLDLLSETNSLATCFFLGWVAERFPHLVKEAHRRGHEIASHGYSHRLVWTMTPREFAQDATRSKVILEQIVGQRVLGYRSAGFSVIERTPWFFDVLAEAGYQYDSSVFPARRAHGGLRGSPKAPYRIDHPGGLIEFPITVADIINRPICFFGGGYLRLFPFFLIKGKAQEVLSQGRPVIFYVHPREIDPHHPRLAMNGVRRFKSYVNLKTTEQKIRRLLFEFHVTTFERFIAKNPRQFLRTNESVVPYRGSKEET